MRYTSRYKELSFYVGSHEYKFRDGVFFAETDEQMGALSKLRDAIADTDADPEGNESADVKAPRKPRTKVKPADE